MMHNRPDLFDVDEYLVDMQGISKGFGANLALSDVSLKLAPGSVHALMGENGAGKSTLMKILAGVHVPDRGEIVLNGAAYAPQNPKQAHEAGVSTVFQELSLLPNLSIAENMFLGKEPVGRLGLIDKKRMIAETAAALAELKLDLSPNTLVSELSIAERQFVEIAHGVKADADVFILDEPTAALTAADVEVLNAQIARLKSVGKAIVYISHRMEEIFDVCDAVTVLKDGQHVATRPLEGLTQNALIALMVGRDIQDLFPDRGETVGDAALTVRDLQIDVDSAPVAFELRRGEIVGLAGLEGQGQQSIIRSIVGASQPVSGQVLTAGKAVVLPLSSRTGIRLMQRMGIGFVPEDRKEEGLYLGLPIAHNLTMGLHSQNAGVAWARGYRDKIAEVMASMNVRAASVNHSVSSLSGGNQQKVLLGRYLATGVDVLLIEEPTRVVDIGAKAEIYKLLRSFADDGGAVLVTSRETLELIGMSDRILVVHDNSIVAEMPSRQATEHDILEAALVADRREDAGA